MKYSLDAAIERAKLPISVQYDPSIYPFFPWRIIANALDNIGLVYDENIKREYLWQRTRLLNQSREDRLS